MASLNPQTYVNPTESYFLLSSATNYNSPADFRNPTTGSSANIIVGNVQTDIQLQKSDDTVVNQITQTEGETEFFVGTTNYPSVQILPGALNVNGYIAVTDLPYSNMYFDITPGDNTNPSYLFNHASAVGGVDSAITFARSGFINTTDFVNVGSTSAATINVGPPGGNRVAAGPSRFAFANGLNPTGGMYQVGSNIIIGQGADPGVAGAGVSVGPTTVGFLKPINAGAGGISMTAQGAIRSISSANNVGGLLQAQNGNFVVNLQALGDAFTPNGVGGSLTAFNAGANTQSPLTLNTGVGSSIIGASDNVMNIAANATINLTAPTTNLNSTTAINLTSPTTNLNSTTAINLNASGAGADIILTAADTINLVAPQVLINGSPSTSLTFYYQCGGSEQAIDGNSTIGGGSFISWAVPLYETPGYGIRFLSSQTSVWTVPVPGVYLVGVNLLCNLQNATAGMSIDLLRLPSGGGSPVQIGCQMRPAGYQPTTSAPPSNLPFNQSAAGMLSGTFYVKLFAGDSLLMCGGTFDPGGFLYVQPQSTWSMQYIAAQ